jgi:hypothetical protein
LYLIRVIPAKEEALRVLDLSLPRGEKVATERKQQDVTRAVIDEDSSSNYRWWVVLAVLTVAGFILRMIMAEGEATI